MSSRRQLKFQPLSTVIAPAFWMVLGRRKLEHLRLDDEEIPIWGWYMAGSPRLHITEECLGAEDELGREWPPHEHDDELVEKKEEKKGHRATLRVQASLTRTRLRGTLKLFNTMEQFREQLEYRQSFADSLRPIIVQALGSSSKDEYEMACRFRMLAFADLKKHHYYYHCLYPALALPLHYTHAEEVVARASLESTMTPEMAVEQEKDVQTASSPPSLVDPTDCDEMGVLGWPLRMFLLRRSLQGDTGSSDNVIICVRGDRRAIRLWIVSPFEDAESASSSSLQERMAVLSTVPVTGWERNEQGQVAPRSVNLSPLLDPQVLAREAADLNLKLIRWRLLPELNLETHASARILLLGAGTLGCNLVRLLLAWGFRHLTLVDSGQVSLSNPPRQSLFSLNDVGSSKAEAAARKASAEIDPAARIKGHHLAIPMPGHRIIEEEATRRDIERIWSLVREHDVLLLLTDSRESRWLPTVLGALEGRLVLTVALGFDSYVVMRHGMGDNQLSCYFCADARGPADTLSGRTLDQQCTVTRPGVAYLAAGVAVELLASLLQHKRGGAAPVLSSASPVEELPKGAASLLGVTPHQQRGYIGHLSGLQLAGEAYRYCTACSPHLLEAVRQGGVDFIMEILQDPGRLPRIARGPREDHAEIGAGDPYRWLETERRDDPDGDGDEGSVLEFCLTEYESGSESELGSKTKGDLEGSACP